MTNSKIKKKTLLWIIIPLACIAILLLAFFAYVSSGYQADTDAIQSYLPNIKDEYTEFDGGISIGDESADFGLIFYPGGKVDHTAYIPLMNECAKRGIFCVLLEMPFDLAVFDIDAAEGIKEKYPEIDSWYIGGHSLGGSMAASYLCKNADEFCGLVLLGSYSTADISETGLSVLSLYGSEDLVLNRDKYSESKANLPTDYTEKVIEGGCHAGFAMYGEQKGDGKPSISTLEQIILSSSIIAEFVFS